MSQLVQVGLLLDVSRKRNWLPSSLASAQFLYDADGYYSGKPGSTYLNGRYFNSFQEAGGTYTGGAGFKTSQTLLGELTGPYPANTLGETDYGLGVWEARTNKCTNYNRNPTVTTNFTKAGDAAAVFSIVDDAVELGLAGLAGLCDTGKVFKLDNSAGVGVSSLSNGATGNTNPHVASLYARGSGTFSVHVAGDGLGPGTTFAATAHYARYAQAIPTPPNQPWQLVVAAGSVVYFILNQLEEGAFVTQVIPVEGVAATRTADAPLITGIAPLIARPVVFFVEVQCPAISGTNRTFLDIGDGSNSNRVWIVRNSSDKIQVLQTTSGVGQAATTTTATYSGSFSSKIAVRLRDGVRASAIDNVLFPDVAVTNTPGMDRAFIGTSFSGINIVNGYVRKVAVLPDMSDAELQALTA